jgi:hypothetical protein
MGKSFKGRLAILGLVTLLFGLISGLYGFLLAAVELELMFSSIETEVPQTGINGVAWSPDSSQLAFECVWRLFQEQKEIYIMAADGSNIRPFTDNWPIKNFSREARSPDGSQSAFVEGGGYSENLCGSNLYVSNSIGGARRVYPPLEISLRCPRFLNERGTITARISSASAQNLPVSIRVVNDPLHFAVNRNITLAAHETVEISWAISPSGDARAYTLKAFAASAGVQQVAKCSIMIGSEPPSGLAILDNLGLTAGHVLLLSLVGLLLGVALPVPWLYARWGQKRQKWLNKAEDKDA